MKIISTDRHLLCMSKKNEMLEKAFPENSKYQPLKNEQNEERAGGYVPKHCDLKCYKCRYQGVCIVPRRLMAAWRRYALENKNFLLNRKYELNSLSSILLSSRNYRKILHSLISSMKRLNRKFSRYGKNSKYER